MIGVVGLGAMGRGIATTLLRERKDVMVFEIDKAKMKRIVAAGATAAPSAADLSSQCQLILVSLPNAQVTVDVLEKELLPHVKEDVVVIDTGTTVVRETRRMASLFRERRAYFVDAPVSGGPVGTAKGELFAFVGGDKEAVDKAWPTLKLLSKSRLTYCGPSGAGQITKGVNQLAMGLVNAAVVESIAYGAASGVDESVLLEAIGGSDGFRDDVTRVGSQIVCGLGDAINYKYTEYEYFLDQADEIGFAAPIMRAVNRYIKPFPHDVIDNLNRPHPSLWGALMGITKPEPNSKNVETQQGNRGTK